MVIILLGIIGFLSGIIFDAVTLKGPRGAKPLLWVAVSLLLGYAHLAAGLSPDKLPIPEWLQWPGWLLLVAGALLMVYSLFLEIPFSKTYAQAGASNMLVQQGTYALTRHPGVLWYAVLLSGLVLASQSRVALWAAPVWLAMDVLWVWVEDRFLFEQMFEGYRDYKRTTPMLIPSWASMQRCWETLPLRKLAGRLAGAGAGHEAGP